MMPILDLTLWARATTRGQGDEEEPAKEFKNDQLLRKERNQREGYTQGKVQKVLQEGG